MICQNFHLLDFFIQIGDVILLNFDVTHKICSFQLVSNLHFLELFLDFESITYSNVLNKHAYMFISRKVCLLGSIKLFFYQKRYYTVFQSSPIKGVTPNPYATGVPFLLGRFYHLTRVSVCALLKYFFQIGRKQEMNTD